MTEQITTRNDLIVEAFQRGKSLGEIQQLCKEPISRQGISYILRRELGSAAYAKQKFDNQATRRNRSYASALDRKNDLIQEYYNAEYRQGPTADLLEIRSEIRAEHPKISVSVHNLAFEEYLTTTREPREAEALRVRLRGAPASRKRAWTDKDLRGFLEAAYQEITDSGASFSVQAYNRWASENAAPTSQTLVKWLAPDKRAWSKVAALVDPTALKRADRGPAKTWSDDQVDALLRRFATWAVRNKRPATRAAYEEYTSRLATSSPSLAALRVRYGTWSATMAGKI